MICTEYFLIWDRINETMLHPDDYNRKCPSAQNISHIIPNLRLCFVCYTSLMTTYPLWCGYPGAAWTGCGGGPGQWWPCGTLWPCGARRRGHLNIHVTLIGVQWIIFIRLIQVYISIYTKCTNPIGVLTNNQSIPENLKLGWYSKD